MVQNAINIKGKQPELHQLSCIINFRHTEDLKFKDKEMQRQWKNQIQYLNLR